MERRESQHRRRDLPVTWIPGFKESATTIVDSANRVQTSRLVGTPSVLQQVNYFELQSAVERHLKGDWGLVSPRDAARNNVSLHIGEAVISAFQNSERVRFWIITNSDRSQTAVMLPSDFRRLQQPQSICKIVWSVVTRLWWGCFYSLRRIASQVRYAKLRRIVNRRFAAMAFLAYAIPEVVYYMFCLTASALREVESLFAGF